MTTHRRTFRANMAHRNRSRAHKTIGLQLPSPLSHPPTGEWKQRHDRKDARLFCAALKTLELLQRGGGESIARVEVYPCTWGADPRDGPRAEIRRHWHLGRGRLT